MKKTVLSIYLTCALITVLTTIQCLGNDIETMPPVVVKTVPQAGSKDVAPSTSEIRITFSKPMTDKSWSLVEPWKGANAPVVSGPQYEKDQKTLVLKVKLEPNKTYAYWVNTQRFQNFKDSKGNPAVPYLLVFQTTDK